MSNGDRPRGFELSRAHLVTACVLAFVITLGCFAWAANVTGAWNVVASALASTFLSVAVATLLTEIILKPAFTRDVLGVAALRERLHRVGIRDSVPESSIDWIEFYRGSQAVAFVISRPAQWVRTHMALILDAATHRAISVDLYVVDPDGAAAENFASALGVEAATLAAEIKVAIDDISPTWSQARARDALHKKASVGIHLLQSRPLHTLARFDDDVVVLMPSLVAERTSPDLAFLFEQREVSDVSRWLDDRWRAMVDQAADIPAYEEGRSR